MAEVELQQIGPYALTELLRVSSTSTFYRAKQRKKELLIKRFDQPFTSTEAKEAFLARARYFKKLKNRTIVNVLDAGFEGDYGYLVMEYSEGTTLSDFIAPGSRLAPDEVKRLLSPVADALHYAHVNSVLHGNLHPGNIIRTPQGALLLTEFALAIPDMTLDDTEFAVPYMAPEQLRGEPDAASDQYALAVMAYEWLCGRRPFDATERSLLLQQQQQGTIAPPRSINDAISTEVEHVLLRALALDPDQRFPHTQDFASHYLGALMGFTVKTNTAPLPRLTVPKTPSFLSATSNGTHSIPPTTTVEQPVERTATPAQETATGPEVAPKVAQRPTVEAPPVEEEPAAPEPLNPEPIKKIPRIAASAQGESRLRFTISEDLRQGGVLSHSLPGYEERLAQIEMASVVAQALTESKHAVIEASTGTGKALHVDTPIPTPSGWTKMGDLKAGDTVFDEQGQPTEVTAAFDILHDRPCYSILFSDRSTMFADGEHEWVCHTVNNGRIGPQTTVTTEQIARTLKLARSSTRSNYGIALPGALKLPEVELPIDPYLLGQTIGSQDDGSIPPLYLRASEEQRRALLAGLLDTSATVDIDGMITCTVASWILVQDIFTLLCTLGIAGKKSLPIYNAATKRVTEERSVTFRTEQQIFRLPYKVEEHQQWHQDSDLPYDNLRYILEVNEVPSEPVRCIQVAAPSHLYLAGEAMIPTHNSLAYLVPVVRSGKVAIVSTANKALQEQLFYKDIPFVQQHIKPFEAALVKGIGNYVCIDRMENERVGMQFYAKNRDFKRLVDMVDDPESDFLGDFETLGFQLPSDIRSRINADSDQCAWNKCSSFAECYVRMMRERAERAQVIVVNHTLLLLDAVIGGFLLPDRDVIVLDEAHHLEEEATRSFTYTIAPNQIVMLLAQRMLRDHSLLSLQDEVYKNAETMWARLAQVANPGFKGRSNLEEPLEEGLKLATSIADLADSLRRQRPKDMPEKEGQLYDKLIKRTQNLSDTVRIIFSVAQPDKFVYYVERMEASATRVTLQASAAPLDVTGFLKERLFSKYNVICTSATLATVGPSSGKAEARGPNFNYFRRRVGLDAEEMPDVLERILPLTFDYESNALLYLPRDLPEPTFGAGADDYMKAIAREMYRLVRLSRGRAFLLFSSKRMLDRAYELMSPHLDYPLLKQGDMTRIELTRRFRQEEGAILFGLKSFWEGVDIAGEALSLVVIDKLPFDPPDDPVHEARVAQMKAAGENWFGTYVLPQAVLRLKQGIGRLLRSRDDRGVMAILDTRLHTKGYGKLVLNALPPARRSSLIKDVERFFHQ